MELIKAGSFDGRWFPYAGDAEFKIRRIPTGLEKESYFRNFGKRAEVRRKDGAVISETNIEAAQAHSLELARYALLDSKNALVPHDVVKDCGTFEPDAEGMVRLDGQWTDRVKTAVLSEVLSLASWIVERAQTLTQKAAEEDEELGKTS